MNIPTELLRSFAAISDTGSMLQATQRVFVTQSALSLQMKRLEDLLQTRLFQREGRRLKLTPAGQSLLDHAREILEANDRAVQALSGDLLAGPARIGVAQDFAEDFLSGILADFAEHNPQTQIRVRVGNNTELLNLLQTGQLDALFCTGDPGDPAAVRDVPMTWFGSRNLLRQDVIPLAVLERHCQFRESALAALKQSGQPYRIVLETPLLAALRAAVDSGLAITCRTPQFMKTALGPNAKLPKLPRTAYIRHVRSNAHPVINQFVALLDKAALSLA